MIKNRLFTCFYSIGNYNYSRYNYAYLIYKRYINFQAKFLKKKFKIWKNSINYYKVSQIKINKVFSKFYNKDNKIDINSLSLYKFLKNSLFENYIILCNNYSFEIVSNWMNLNNEKQTHFKDTINSNNNILNIPNIPNIPNVPSIPKMPNIPKVPNIPDIPGIPNIPNIPKVPNIPNIPKVPNIPNIPKVPNIPNVPKVPNIANIPNIPSIPNIPNVPSIPSIPNIPNISNMPNVPNIPNISNLIGVNKLSNNKPISNIPKPKENEETRKINWTIINKAKISESFWNKPVKERFTIDYDLISKYFSKQKEDLNKIKSEENKESKQAVENIPQTIKLLDDKKLMNLGIGLAKVNISKEKLKEDLLLFNYKSKDLSIDTIDKIIPLLPSKEDIEILNKYQGDISLLSSSEQFLKVITEIPMFKQVFEYLKIRNNLFSEINDIKSKVNTFNEYIEVLNTSIHYKSILRIMLQFGNYLNYGTRLGNQIGFGITSLSSIISAKSFNDKNMNLLDLLVIQIKNKDPTLLLFYKEFEAVIKNFDLEVDDIKSNINLFENLKRRIIRDKEALLISNSKFNNNNNKVLAIKKDKELKIFNDNFISFLECLESDLLSSLEILNISYNKLEYNIKECYRIYGEDIKKIKIEQLIKHLQDFIRKFKESIEKVNTKEAKELKKKKKEEKSLTKPIKIENNNNNNNIKLNNNKETEKTNNIKLNNNNNKNITKRKTVLKVNNLDNGRITNLNTKKKQFIYNLDNINNNYNSKVVLKDYRELNHLVKSLDFRNSVYNKEKFNDNKEFMLLKSINKKNKKTEEKYNSNSANNQLDNKNNTNTNFNDSLNIKPKNLAFKLNKHAVASSSTYMFKDNDTAYNKCSNNYINNLNSSSNNNNNNNIDLENYMSIVKINNNDNNDAIINKKNQSNKSLNDFLAVKPFNN